MAFLLSSLQKDLKELLLSVCPVAFRNVNNPGVDYGVASGDLPALQSKSATPRTLTEQH